MRTRKFLSTLIPALPMLLTALLVILVTVIFLTAMRSKAHAQFGGVEQPMFQLTSTAQTPEQQLMRFTQYRWIATNLSDGSFNTWTDVVQGASFKLDTSLLMRWIVKDTNGVAFEAKGEDTLVAPHVLTNASLDWKSNTSVAFILNRPLQWSHYLQAPAADNTQPFLWANTNAVNPYAGWEFENGDVLETGSFIEMNAGYSGPQLTDAGFGSNGWCRLIFSQWATNLTNYVSVWTNSVSSYSNRVFGGWNLHLHGGPHFLGYNSNRKTQPTMFIQEIWVFTNAPNGSDGVGFSDENLGLFERYATNRYIAVNSNAWPYASIARYDASLGVLNASDSPAANGDKIKTWQNQAPANWPLTQLGPNNLRPYWVSSGGPNNLPYVSFPGTNATSNSRMTNQYVFRAYQTNMVFMVFRFFDYGRAFQLFFDDGLASTAHIGTSDDKNLRFFTGGTGADGPNTIPTNTWMLVTMVWNAANSFMRTNGVLYKASATTAATYEGFSLGSAGNGTTSAAFDVAEVRVYSRGNMTSNDMHTVEAELGTKYGFTIP